MRSTQIVLALAPLLAMAQDDVVTTTTDSTWAGDATTGYYSETFATEVPVTEYLNQFYGTATPAGATGAVATSLASALYSLQTELVTDMAYRSAANEVYLAVATRSDADDILSSIDNQGFLNGGYSTASWYAAIPSSAKNELASVVSDFQAVQTSVLGAASGATVTATGATTTTASGLVTATSTGSSKSGSTATTTSATSSSTAGAHGSRATGGAAAGLAAVVAVGAAVLW